MTPDRAEDHAINMLVGFLGFNHAKTRTAQSAVAVSNRELAEQ